MKTLKLKKIATLTSIIIIMLFSTPMFSAGDPGLPEDIEPTTNDQVPIDQNIWLGLVVGCMIGAYFFVGKQKNALTK
jgi:hypothetical protein